MQVKSRIVVSALVALFTLSCGEKSSHNNGDTVLLSPINRYSESSTAGNLMATAIKETNKVDVVLYPSGFIRDDGFALLDPINNESGIDHIIAMYPDGVQDQFLIGTMRGSNLKKLVYDRARKQYSTELQTAGLEYDFHFVGGIPTVKNINFEQGREIEDGTSYRVAVSNYFFFSGATFPSYKYNNSMQSNLRQEPGMISARGSLRRYLAGMKTIPNIKDIRARVTNHSRGSAGNKTIQEIQGSQHLSPYFGQQVTTSGIITAIAGREWFPGGTDFYLQAEKSDGDDLTSEAIGGYFKQELIDLKEGDLIEVTATVFEEMTTTGLSRTTLRDIESYTIISRDNTLPEPVAIGVGGRAIPDRVISSFRGNLNTKPVLNLEDGIDFWESLEGMLISIKNPRVIGFRGGKVEAESTKPKSYLNLHVVADGDQPNSATTGSGGLTIVPETLDFNPEIIQLTTHTMAKGIAEDQIYQNGDILTGKLDGIMSYEENIFGDGSYTLLIRNPHDTFEKRKRTTLLNLDKRPATNLVANDRTLTVATFNVENLGGNQITRIGRVATAVMDLLKCPDVVNFVEIQDRDGEEFGSSSKAIATLERLISMIDNCPNVDYKPINIDPINNGEGGVPGGNIRVAMLFNSKKLGFTPKGVVGPLTETIVERDGSMSHNPGRVFPNDPAFNRTRKSIVVQFDYLGEKVFILGNHFNSKLGDSSFWSATQPPEFDSNKKRGQLADRINDFVTLLEAKNPGAHIIVLGDFNAYFFENPMKVLESDKLTNLISYGNLVPANDRYTTNYNGNSMPLDYIFVNKHLLEHDPKLEILHINSDYMGRISDHDPVISSFRF